MDLFDIAVASKLAGGGGGGGGGSSNIVTGEFTTSSATGTVENITIPYSGNGYPVSVHLYIIDNSDIGNTKAVVSHYVEKANKDIAPTYDGTYGTDLAKVYAVTKYSTSDTSRCSLSSTLESTGTYLDDEAVDVGLYTMRIRNKNTISLYKNTTKVGFLPNKKYGYIVEYSS